MIKIYNKEEYMNNAVSKGEIGKIKILRELGVAFPTIKKPYGELFQQLTSSNKEAQDYIIQNIENITIGEQVILRTLLHDKSGTRSDEKKINLIQQIVERYDDNQLELLIKATAKRIETNEVNFVNNFYRYKKLQKEIQEKTEIKTIKVKI